jgi:regulatory protein
MRKRRPEPSDSADRAAARNTAMGLLARREHATAEIEHKLRYRGFDNETTAEVVDELSRRRLLSDERFAEVFIRSRADRGQGPVRLRAELRQLKLPAELIERYLKAAEVDWIALAREVRQRKFGARIAKLPAERAKQVRFLQYRGFTADQIRAALGSRTMADDDLLNVADDETP